MSDKDLENLINEHTPLVYKILYRRNLLHNPDMLSVAMWGLAKACKSFDPNRGFKFSTYAFRIINNQINMAYRQVNKVKNEISYEACIENYNNDDTWNTAPVESICAIEDIAITVENKFTLNSLRKVLAGILNELNPSTTKYKVYATWYSSDFTYTQRQLSTICGCSQAQISRIQQWLRVYIRKRIEEESL